MEESIKRTRAKKKYLRVTFPNGDVICYKNATSTMIATLNRIGEDKFPQIKLELCHLPLVSREMYSKYKKDMKIICEGWFLNAQSNSACKYLQLKAISDQLGLGLKVELGDDLETQKEPATEKRIRVIDKLLVKMSDGEYLANDSALETFLEAIWQLDIDEIAKKELSWGGNPLITRTKIFKNQVQVGTDKWMIIPSTTRDKAKLLRVIAAMLHIKMDINII